MFWVECFRGVCAGTNTAPYKPAQQATCIFRLMVVAAHFPPLALRAFDFIHVAFVCTLVLIRVVCISLMSLLIGVGPLLRCVRWLGTPRRIISPSYRRLVFLARRRCILHSSSGVATIVFKTICTSPHAQPLTCV